MGLATGLLDLVFSPRCLGCGGPAGAVVGAGPAGAAERLICGRCRSRLTPPPPPLCDRCGYPRLRTGRQPGPVCPECQDWPAGLRVARSAFLLRDPAASLVHQLKYRGWKALAQPMAHRMAMVPLPPDVGAEARLVVPVPTTTVRLRERGYNQAEVLAGAFAETTGRTLFRGLVREGGRSSQTTLQPAARLANVAGAFRPVAEPQVRLDGEHLLLVDDVLTTGATVIACVQSLVSAGARCVSVLTFARATGRLRLI